MGRTTDLPDELGGEFSTALARRHGVSRSRMRGSDLRAPFFGVRIAAEAAFDTDAEDPYRRQQLIRIARAREYAPRLHTGHFFSHHTAAAIWGGPLPLEFAEDGRIADDLRPHVSALGPLAEPRTTGVIGHRTRASFTEISEHDRLRVSSPAATWASLGALSLYDLIALGDYFCRQWRHGYGRPTPGKPPLATTADLRAMLGVGRRLGADRLRAALPRIREDSWSPRESLVRCLLVDAGLPEPRLNVDVRDDTGRFLGCVDMAYPDQKVAIEYLGMTHGATWAADVERIAALRAAGWVVIEVTAPLLRSPETLIHRVATALRRPR
ncbi:conserved hypothetical protein [Microbacterium sp. 8M]|uniref:hypothetical protein n=1 Tax=Microbacterium sp. 8M TaxID=2653153 RepID=UPI0012F1D7D2|nr:hypothetical protein [Microbacterium sp. 8M]VXB22085.1 conserved hypothetical protein [Microbacterium sp. 8M]